MCRAAERRALLAAAGAAALGVPARARAADGVPACARPLFLTIDTGHMGVAPLVAEVLARHGVKATFFLANEKTLTGGGSLDDTWAPWWRERAREGHLFGSHTFDHVYWRADRAGPGGVAFDVKPTFGTDAGRVLRWSAADYCAELRRSAARFTAITGQSMAPLFRAPGGKASPALLRAARGCGWHHVPWSPAGFLGDELPSESHPNAALLDKALRDLRGGEILLMHLGIWSRREPWAPAVLEPLIAGLKKRGHCFATLAEHPDYRAALAAPPVAAPR